MTISFSVTPTSDAWFGPSAGAAPGWAAAAAPGSVGAPAGVAPGVAPGVVCAEGVRSGAGRAGEAAPGAVWPASALTGDPDLIAELQAAVDDANKAVSRAESIRRFHVLDTDFTEQAGYLTPSLKLRRNVVTKDFADQIEALYS